MYNNNLASKRLNQILSFNNLYDFNKSFTEVINYIKTIPRKNIINKKITAYGNYFYNAISYFNEILNLI